MSLPSVEFCSRNLMVSVAGPKVTAGLEVEVHRFRLSQVSSGSFGERSVMSPLLTLHPTCLPTGKAFWIPACAEEKTQHFRGSGFFFGGWCPFESIRHADWLAKAIGWPVPLRRPLELEALRMFRRNCRVSVMRYMLRKPHEQRPVRMHAGRVVRTPD